MTRFSSVVLVDRRGWILLQERDQHPEIDPERWGYCGGHLEEDEDFEEGAYRELAEETGLELDDGLRLFGEFPVFHEHSQSLDSHQLFVMDTDLTDDDIACFEGRQIVFVDPATITDLPLTRAASESLPVFLASDVYEEMLG
jgi:ADP-ribose pyrophosphatase YjhB (NUDIX family)